MMPDAVAAIQRIYRAAVERVQPRAVLRSNLHLDGSILTVGTREYDIEAQPAYAIAFGKAAVEMMSEVETVLGSHLVGGIVVTKSAAPEAAVRSKLFEGAHPVPDQRSLAAGEAVLRFAHELPPGALVLCLISGGGSALMEALRPSVTLDDLQRVTRELLRAGASIHELNTVRARMSALKAGGLLAALGDVEVVNLVLSDVLGDDLATIASGPTVPRQAGETAEAVLERYGVEVTLPEDRGDATSANPHTIIAGNLSAAINEAAREARSIGFNPVVLTRSLTGEARHVATALASVLADSAAGLTEFGPGTCLIAGGETTVTVRGDGLGGRNTEAALAAAIRLCGVEGVAIGFLATDGDDAETGVAGGIVTGKTVSAENLAGARRALEDNDSFTWLDRAGGTWGTGPSGTNVNDLVIGIVS